MCRTSARSHACRRAHEWMPLSHMSSRKNNVRRHFLCSGYNVLVGLRPFSLCQLRFTATSRLAPALESRPDFFERVEFRPPAEVHIEMLVRHREGMVDHAHFFHAFK